MYILLFSIKVQVFLSETMRGCLFISYSLAVANAISQENIKYIHQAFTWFSFLYLKHTLQYQLTEIL